MWIQNFFKSLTSTPTRRRPARRRPPASRPCFETLEDRCLLSFSPAVGYPVGTNPQAVLTGDFNGDTRLDVAVVNYSSSNVSVLLGNPDGTFGTALNSPTGAGPQSVAVGDFNADGKLDLATANANDVSVLLGNGNGTFQAPTNIGISDPASVAVGDFNADGKLDLGVTSNDYSPGSWGYYGWYPGYYVGVANVLLGTGAGSFSTPNGTSLGYGFHTSAVVADFNGDGKQDFAAGSSESSAIAVLLGTVTGLGAPNYFTAGLSRSMTAGDVNADGKADLVTANLYGDYVAVLLGTGLGTFGAAQYYPVGSAANSVAVADFNGDGKIDLVTANWDTGTVSVLLGAGAGAFKPPVNAAVGSYPLGAAVGDFNGDGRPDAASANPNSNNVSVLLNDGTWPSLDAPSITINDVTLTEGNTGSVSASFTVNLSAAYGQTVSVHYATADGSATVAGSDYQAASGTLTIPAGQTSGTITVQVIGDRLAEYSESFYVRLSNPTNAFVADATGAGTILDDEPYASIVDYVTGVEGNTGTTPFTFTVTLSAAYDAPVTVDYATADLTPDEEYWYGWPGATAGVDYTATSGTVTFAAGETSKTITVLVTGDRVGELDEAFFVNLSNPSGAQLGSSQAVGYIVDDEPRVSINSSASVMEGNTGTTALTFTVTLSAAYDGPVTVSYATVDGSALAGSDYVAASGTLTFTAGQTSLPLPVAVKGDVLAESDEYLSVQLSGATSGVIANGWGYGTILDDDTPPSISISDASAVEGNSGTRLMTFTVSLSQVSGQGVWVNYATANGTATTRDNDYVAKSGTLYFAPGERFKTIEVVIKGDTKKEKDERFYVNLSGAIYGSIADGQGVGTILNDDFGGRGSNRILSAWAIDAAIEDFMSGRPKKRGR